MIRVVVENTTLVHLRLNGRWSTAEDRGAAAQDTARRANAYMAWYLLNAGRRISKRVAQGETLEDAVEAEERHTRAHLAAQRRRAEAAREVDRVAEREAARQAAAGGRPAPPPGTVITGVLLVWDATLDERTTEECEAAHGHTFMSHVPPKIGYPGTVHLWCRCKPRPALLADVAKPSVDQATSHLIGDGHTQAIPDPLDLANHYDPDQPRDSEGKWTTAPHAPRPAIPAPAGARNRAQPPLIHWDTSRNLVRPTITDDVVQQAYEGISRVRRDGVVELRGGHKFGKLRPGKGEFPADWTAEKVREAAELALDAHHFWYQQANGGNRYAVRREVDGVILAVEWFYDPRTGDPVTHIVPLNGHGVWLNDRTTGRRPEPLDRTALHDYNWRP